MTGLANKPAFFDWLRSSKLLGETLSTDEVKGLEALTSAFGAASWPLAFAAYGLATAYHETAHTMLPVKELGGTAYFMRMYDKTGNRPKVAADLGNTQVGDGALFAGRGYPQLTGRRNYTRADTELGLKGELLRNPDLAMRPDIAARIMVLGMSEGWFTGRSLKSYLTTLTPGTRAQFVEARRIINGQDRAGDIADYALAFQKALQAGGWQ